MIKRIGILTFHASHNYGSMLQAYAMQTYLKKRGIEAENINLRTNIQKNMYAYPWNPTSIRSIIKFLFYPKWMIENIKKWNLFEKFLKQDLHITSNEYHSWEEIEKDLSKLNYGAILCGGDQIWNLNCPDFDKSYLLPSELKGINKIAYSPSPGGALNEFSNSQKEIFKSYISKFNFISVRDAEASSFMTDLLQQHVPSVADPTLLLQASDYDKIIPQAPIIKGDYMLYYTPYYSEYSLKIAKQLASQYKLKLITTNGNIQSGKGLTKYQAVGPKEFLNILKYAKFVCGQSFHLIIFSIMYHKEFIAMDGNKDARMKGFLKLCGLSERGIDLKKPQIGNYPAIDYASVEKKLSTFRQQSIQYIDSFIEN